MKTLTVALLAAGLLGGPALAQQPGAPPAGTVGSTRTGDAPEKTGSTTTIGQTKPPGSPIGDGLGTRPDLEEKSRDLTRRIQQDICTGCN